MRARGQAARGAGARGAAGGSGQAAGSRGGGGPESGGKHGAAGAGGGRAERQLHGAVAVHAAGAALRHLRGRGHGEAGRGRRRRAAARPGPLTGVSPQELSGLGARKSLLSP